jgi:hypothetical protein
MKMQRRKLVKVGYVNFPFNSKEYKNSGEGGMVVKLVVTGKKRNKSSFMYGVCCGASITEVMAEALVGDDKRPMPNLNKAENFMSPELAQKTLNKIRAWDEYYFPRLNAVWERGNDVIGVERYHSVGFAAVIVMGSTGWSGYSDKKGSWVCKYSDLTAEGKKLYNMIQKMYPAQELHLLTYLDT